MSEQQLALGMDLGGSSIKYGAVGLDGKIEMEGSYALETRSVDEVSDLLGRIIENVRHRAGHRLIAAGLGSPGLLDRDRRIVRYSPNFPGWYNVPLADIVEAHLEDLPFAMENDANLLVYSETRWGAAVGRRNVIVLTLGTGVGGGVMVEGRALTGAGGGAAELGFTSVDPNGPDYKVNRGCLEALCNIEGVLRTTTEVYGSRPGSSYDRDGRHGTVPASPEALGRAAEQGDDLARAVWQRVGTSLGIALATFINVFNPEMILVGGGISGAGNHLLDPAREEAQRRSHVENFKDVTIRQAGLGARSGLLGAAALAFDAAGLSAPS
ncbi:ROK family protein [bacterium]|nr:ROK family protein [bacterium]